ncbi:MAG: protein involved in polysaccharide export with SLBB domain [Paraglaciecola sp.]|jgi:protein involved in polysaccharide export with SLBB domain
MKLNYLFVRGSAALTFAFMFAAQAQQSFSQEQLRQAQAASQSQQVDVSQYIQSGGNNTGRGSRVNQPGSSSSRALSPEEQNLPLPYGANLFDGGFETERSDGLNSAYLVAAGDKLSIQMWGAVNRAEVVTVDNQGNIFIPDVGPIKVKDVPANQVNKVVTQSIKSIYTNNVSVYVNLLTATPISVFVTGPVERPGQYAGLASDSLLFFLKRAGGIDPFRGSYRNIQILRHGKIVLEYDLYEFLKEGKLPAFSFKDEDVIFVKEQGAMVTVEGAARFPFRFELEQGKAVGQNLMYYARPLTKSSHVAITGNRENGYISVYLPMPEFSDFTMVDGDTVLFNDDIRPQVISVQISGSYIGPSFYTLDKNTRLLDLLSHIEVDPKQANYGAIYIKRESVVEQQKVLLEESLQRLERSIFTAPASSSGEAAIRAQEAELITQFIARARKVQPLGKVIVSQNGNVANIRLEQGDEIIIPPQTDLIQVSGEVLMPQAIVYNAEATLSDYVAWSGGFSDRADDERIAVMHANGVTSFMPSGGNQLWFANEQGNTLAPGDQILVLPKVDTKLMQSIKDVTQIVYQIAIAANVATK